MSQRAQSAAGSARPSQVGSFRSQRPASQAHGARAAAGTTTNMERTLHDKEQFWNIKQQQSAPFFRGARVQTCSHVLRKGGKAVAVQFPLEKTGWKAPTSYQNTKRSSEITSWSR